MPDPGAKNGILENLKMQKSLVKKEKTPSEYWRPKKRSDCVEGPRPCPYLGCRYNLQLEITPGDSIKILPTGEETCLLDITDRGPMPPSEIARLFGTSKQYIDQTLGKAFRKLRMPLEKLEELAQKEEPAWRTAGKRKR